MQFLSNFQKKRKKPTSHNEQRSCQTVLIFCATKWEDERMNIQRNKQTNFHKEYKRIKRALTKSWLGETKPCNS